MKTRLDLLCFGLVALFASGVGAASTWNTQEYDLYPGDFDGDGSTDVLYVAKAPNGRSGIALSNGVEWVAGAQSWDSDGFGIQWHSNAYKPIIGDFNWDGRDDIFMQRQTPGDHFLLLAQLDGTFAGISQTITNTQAGLTWSADQHRIISLKGKSTDPAHPKGHRLFLQATERGGANAIIDTGFSQLIGSTTVGSPWTDGYRGFNWNLRQSLVHSGDFNGDGEGDLLIQAKPTIVIIDYDVPFPVPTFSAGAFGIVYSPVTNGVTDIWDRMRAGVNWSELNSNVVVGDFDGDGKDDVLVQPKAGTGAAYLMLTNPATNLLNSSPVAVSFANASATGGDSYRILAANINGGPAERLFGVYLQATSAAATDLIANYIGASGGTMATANESSSSQVAGSAERPFTMAYRYNLVGQVTGTIAPDPDKGSTSDGPLKYLATRITYDRGLLVRVETGELQRWVNEMVAPQNWEQVAGFTRFTITEFDYDQYGRKIVERVKRADTGDIESLNQYSYDSASRVLCKAVRMNKAVFTSALPDACTQGTAGTSGPDRISSYTYDALDQVLTEQRGVGTPLVQTYVTKEYNSRLLRFQTDANGNKTELRYDNLARLSRRVYPSPTIPGVVNENDYNEYTYEPNGNVRSERKRNGALITYTYDATNDLRIKDLSDNSQSQDVYYDYFPSGVLRFARFGSSAGPGLLNSIDAFGRILSVVANTAAATSSVGPSRQISYAYDDNGNRTRVTHPDNQFFGYAFDGLNRDCGVAESTLPIACDSPSLIVSVAYGREGGRKSLARGGVVTTYVPNNSGQLASFSQDFPSDVNDLTNQFSYNPAGQITQLIQSSAAYSYVGNANRVGAYTRNGLNQTTSIGGQTIQHDVNGNLTSDAALSYSMIYDMENRLVSTSGSAAVTSSFKYDPFGRLMQLTVGGVTRDFLYDGDTLVAEYESGSVKERYVHGSQVDEPWVQYDLSSVGAANRKYLYADHQGSIIAQSDGVGANVTKLAYDSYGIPLDSNPGRFGYTGQAYIKELGLSYYKARMYSPRLGRFLQTDPIGYKDDMNLYLSVSDDPLNKTDPSGLSEKEFEVLARQHPAGPCPRNTPSSAQACDRLHLMATVSTAVLAAPFAWELGWWAFLNPYEATLGAVIVGDGVVAVAGGAGPGPGSVIEGIAARGAAQVTLNRAAGNAFRDKLAGELSQAGRQVSTEVYKRTPFGKRFIDIEVSQNGTVLGGIETKVGTSRYTPLQQLKDWWLTNIEGYPVNVARQP